MAKLLRLVYVSRACFDFDSESSIINPNVKDILIKCRENNQKSKVGGALYFSNGYFFQCLEGRESSVHELVEKIKLDPRHTEFKISYCKTVRRRFFGSWSMKYIPITKEVTELISSLGYEGFNPIEFSEFDINLLMDLFTRLDDSSLNDVTMKEFHRHEIPWFKRIFQRF